MTMKRVRWILAAIAIALGAAAAFVRTPVNPATVASRAPAIVKPPSGC